MLVQSCVSLSNKNLFSPCSIVVKEEPSASSSSRPSGPAVSDQSMRIRYIQSLHTLRLVTESLQEICSLTNRPLSPLKHIKQESHLAQQAQLVDTSRCSVL